MEKYFYRAGLLMMAIALIPAAMTKSAMDISSFLAGFLFSAAIAFTVAGWHMKTAAENQKEQTQI